MNARVGLILWIAFGAASAAEAQPRPLRLFFSTIGLTNPDDSQSPADDPTPQLGVNPELVTPLNTPLRLYVWAQICPPGTPNNVLYHGVSFRSAVEGSGGVMSGFQFWNYQNGFYGNNAGRWSRLVVGPVGATAADYAGLAVFGGAGINNSAAAFAEDTHYRRFATDGVTRIDCTLLGWVEVGGSQVAELSLRLAEGQSGIAQSGQPPSRPYFGWGDDNDPENSIPEARIHVVPEPAGAALAALAILLIDLRRAARNRTTAEVRRCAVT